MAGVNGGAPIGANLSFTKFLFLILAREDDNTLSRIRSAGTLVGRGFFNDFDADGTRDMQPRETIQFLVANRDLAPRLPGADEPPQRAGDPGEPPERAYRAGDPGAAPGAPPEGLGAARYVIQVSASYRPRLMEVEWELKRRLGAMAEIISIDGSERSPRYTSAEMHQYAYKTARPRMSGRVARHAIILPLSKTSSWWEKTPLERHSYFYPQHDPLTGGHVKGHALAADAGIPTIFRKLYHNPDGYQRPGEYDFVTYFECTDDHCATFDRICAALRDERQNPEWRYVREGPEWRGCRVLRW
jgi:hypothetical protein